MSLIGGVALDAKMRYTLMTHTRSGSSIIYVPRDVQSPLKTVFFHAFARLFCATTHFRHHISHARVTFIIRPAPTTPDYFR
jgi:hypothetical protein